MSPPALILLLIATASATLAHVLWGRRWLQLAIFWLAAFAGCLVVYVANLRLPVATPAPAGVPLIEALIGAWALLLVASRLRV